MSVLNVKQFLSVEARAVLNVAPRLVEACDGRTALTGPPFSELNHRTDEIPHRVTTESLGMGCQNGNPD